MVMHQLFCFASVYIYQEFAEDVDEDRITALWGLVIGLFVVTNINFVWFLSLINSRIFQSEGKGNVDASCVLFRSSN